MKTSAAKRLRSPTGRNNLENMQRSLIEIFADRTKAARLWFVLFVIACIGFGIERVRLADSLGRKPQFIIMDGTSYYIPRALDFTEARDLHVAQIHSAAECLFDRGPGGLDHQERLKRLFDKPSYQQAVRTVQEEAAEFEAKEIHQKIEIAGSKLLQVRDESVLATFEGQLIRSGIFEGKPFVEVLIVTGRFTFSRNPNIVVNGAYPTIVRAFEIELKEAKP